jgi:hypothetical protein
MVYFNVSQEKIGKSLWKNIHDLYERETPINKFNFFEEVFSAQIEGIPIAKPLNDSHGVEPAHFFEDCI